MKRLLLVLALVGLPSQVSAQFPSDNIVLPTFIIPASAVTGGGSVNGSLIPAADNTYDLGATSFRWKDVYVAGSIGVGAAPPGTGQIQTSGTITSGGSLVAGASSFIFFNTRSLLASPADGQLIFSNNAGTASTAVGLGPVQSATSTYELVKKVTAIADAVATDVITVTVPNANHAAVVMVDFVCSTGSTDAFESTRTAQGRAVLARTTGVATVAAVATLEQAQIATVAAGATLTLAYGVSAMSGAAGATQTFTIQVTANDSGNVGGNQCVVNAKLINAQATGITIS